MEQQRANSVSYDLFNPLAIPMAVLFVYTFLILGTFALLLAAAGALAYLRTGKDERLLSVANRVVLAGAVCLLITLLLRLFTSHSLPLATRADTLNLFVLIVAFIAHFLCLQERRRALLPFYLLPLALIAVLSAALAAADFRQPPPLEEFSRIFLLVHVTLAFVAYALFFVASMTSAAYMYQARRLKNRQTTGLFLRLPSLENLDHTLFRLIALGYPLFVLTLVLGLIYAAREPAPLSPTWWLSPKIMLSAAMVALYAASYHARARGWLRGPKLAILVFGGFSSLLLVYLVLVALQMSNYNFYGAS